jgi:hypothetical protein
MRGLRNMRRQLETAGVRPLGVVIVGTQGDSDDFYGY